MTDFIWDVLVAEFDANNLFLVPFRLLVLSSHVVFARGLTDA